MAAVTEAGMLSVSSGSSNANRQAAFGSPHAIFMCVFGLAMRAYDWASLPVPEVVGTANIGSMGRVALFVPQWPEWGTLPKSGMAENCEKNWRTRQDSNL